MRSQDKVFVAIGLIAIIAATGFGGYALFVNSQPNLTSPTPASTSTLQPTILKSYKDGVYTATASYFVPHGNKNSIDVSITIKDSKITVASSKHSYNDNESSAYIDSFESGLNAKVVGQSLKSTSFSRIGGASLTTEGFQTALETIKNEATV